MFKVYHNMQLDYFPDRETATKYYLKCGCTGITNMLSLMKSGDDSIYVGVYGSPSEWQEYSYSESLEQLVCVKGV